MKITFSKAGFFIVELLIVLSIIVLLAVLSISFHMNVDRCTLRFDLHQLYSVCVYLQHYACATGQPQKLSINMQENAFNAQGTRYALTKSIKFGFLPHVYGPPAQPSHVITRAVTFPTNEIYFYPDGAITSGTVYLVNTTQNYMHAFSISVGEKSPMRMYRYDNGAWIQYI